MHGIVCNTAALPAGAIQANKRARTNSVSEARPAASSVGVSARLEKELERTLREFVRMRTVSSDPSLREDCFRGAKYLAHLLESLGTPHPPAPPPTPPPYSNAMLQYFLHSVPEQSHSFCAASASGCPSAKQY